MLRIVYCLLLIISQGVFAQLPMLPDDAEVKPHYQKSLSSGNSGTGANIDVLYHRIQWWVNPNNSINQVTGTVTTIFKTLQPGVGTISFDFNKNSFNNAALQVTVHGAPCSFSFPASGNVNVISISLPEIIETTGSIDSVTIQYAGVPAPDGLGGGLTTHTYTDQNGNTQRYMISLSESYEDRNWWPCKADMQDKIDSMDIAVTVPWRGADTFWVASNGILIDSAIKDSLRTFRYKSRYPIASYLVCMAAAKYNRYYSMVDVGGTPVPVYWYLLANRSPSYYTTAINAMTQMNAVVKAFSSRLGDYPFKNEKHGYYDGLGGAGGMEHQTFSAISPGSLTSVATLDHELMHQWFGDNVTFGTWNDLWLAEGFARYGEGLAAELVPALGYLAFTRRNSAKNAALSLNNVSLWIPDASIESSATIWDSDYGSAVYERGCMLVSMLRALSGDSIFFKTLKNYQTTLAGKSASADSLRNFFSRELHFDLTSFFNDYVGGSANGTTPAGGIGNPVNRVKWNLPAANTITLGMVAQTPTTGSNVDYFHGPVAVHVKGSMASQDTTIVFYDAGNGNLAYAGKGISGPYAGNVLSYVLSFTPVTVIYDDSARTLSTGSMVMDTALRGYTWYGSQSSDWRDSRNWAGCCGVPPQNVDVTIATVNYPAILPDSVTVRNLIINSGKTLALNDHTLTVNGRISGTGSITGAANARLIINATGSDIRLSQTGGADNFLKLLQCNAGSQAKLLSDATVQQLNIHPAAVLTVVSPARLSIQ